MSSAKMGPAYALRSRLRANAITRRISDCGRRSVAVTPALVLRATIDANGEKRGAHAHWSGVLRCGRTYSCPVCCMARSAQRAAELDAMMRVDLLGRWQMLTLTLRHRRGQPLADLISVLMQAWRRVRAMRSVRRIFDRRVTGSCRALEVTWGVENGWHPHIHLLLRTEGWSRAERETLETEWKNAIGAGRFSEYACKWSKPVGSWCAERAKYLSKLGAELAGIAKEPKAGHFSPWQIAERSHLSLFHALWKEYQEAMVGRRTLELDERARKLADAGAEPEPDDVREWRLALYPEEFAALAALERIEPTALQLLLDLIEGASGPDPPREMRALVDWALRGGLAQAA